MTEHTAIRMQQTGGDVRSRENHLEELAAIRVLARANRLKLVRECVLPAARLSGFDEETSRDIQLAVDEACQNVIVHAYGGDGDKPLQITLFRSATGMVIQIRDWALPIDPAGVVLTAEVELAAGVEALRQAVEADAAQAGDVWALVERYRRTGRSELARGLEAGLLGAGLARP